VEDRVAVVLKLDEIRQNQLRGADVFVEGFVIHES